MDAESRTKKGFVFTDSWNNNEALSVEIPEKADPAYGMYVWPCAVVLAQYIWYNREHLLTNKHVLELGAGTSLPSIVAIKCGKASSVTITDDPHQPRCIENCRLSCAANSILLREASKVSGTSTRVEGLRWGEVPPGLFHNSTLQEPLPWPDIILGSDCFFDESVHEKLFFTIRYLFEGRLSVAKNHQVIPRFLFTYQIRNAKSNFDDLLRLWDLTCTDILLSTFEADVYDIAGSSMPGSHEIKMFEIKLSDT